MGSKKCGSLYESNDRCRVERIFLSLPVKEVKNERHTFDMTAATLKTAATIDVRMT